MNNNQNNITNTTIQMSLIPGFSQYYITNTGKVWSSKSHKWLKITNGSVILKKNGKHITLSIQDLLRKKFKNLAISETP